MLAFLQNILPTFIVLGVLILIHECGHFLFAKLSGVSVEKLSIGFGPVIARFKHKETEYALSLIPLGGFVKMAGETIEDRSEGELLPTDFLTQGVIKRFMIIFGGPLMNYVLAFVLFVVVFLCGKPSLSTTIGELIENYPAQKAGIIVDDVIVAIDGDAVETWTEVRDAINNSENNAVLVTVQRDTEMIDFTIVPHSVDEKDRFGDPVYAKKIGIYPSDKTVLIRYSFVDAVAESVKMTYMITALSLKALYRLVTGRLNLKVISGPLGIMVIASETAKLGLLHLIQLTALLSVSLAIFNLLPIPALDGGHLFFIMCEAILRKPISFKLQERFAQVGFVLLMVLMAVVVWNDAINFEIFEKIKNLIPFLSH